MSLVFVDVEATFGVACPNLDAGGMTKFGAVEFKTRETYYGIPRSADLDIIFPAADSWYATMIKFESWLHKFKPPYVFVSDNPAYDWQWINYHFHHSLGRNPFGHSARRIGDFYAGLVGDFRAASKWKKLRVTKHDHNPVHDALGNCEAFDRMLKGER